MAICKGRAKSGKRCRARSGPQYKEGLEELGKLLVYAAILPVYSVAN